MTLRCQLKAVKCPPYKHDGPFQPDNETVKALWPDLERCAACIAYCTPKRPDIQGDLLQVAALTLLEKGPVFDPAHKSDASFGSFIRARICGALMYAKQREVIHSAREICQPKPEPPNHDLTFTTLNPEKDFLLQVPDTHAEFEEELLRNISIETALPKLLKTLTPREQDVFTCIRKNQRNCEIAQTLGISEGRVSQLVTQLTTKLTRKAQELGLAE